MKVPEILYHTFVADFEQPPVVVDAGGAEGQFSEYMIRNFNARTYLLEPIPKFFAALPKHPAIRCFEEALTAKDGPVILDTTHGYGSVHPGAAPEKPVTVKGVSLGTLLARIPEPEIDLFKMDIEGSEIQLLEEASAELLLRIRQLTVEFHDFVYAELGPRVEAIKQRLRGMGFYVINFSLNNGNVLFIRRDRLSWPMYLWLKYPLKYYRGLKRLLKRHILRQNI